MRSKYRNVFEPAIIRGVRFKNRLELAPPSPNLASKEGRVTPEFVDFFKPFAKGGVAIIHVGNSVVDRKEACDEERQLDLGSDEAILPLTRFVEMCKGYGVQPSLEINHNGKDSHFEKTGKPALSPSVMISSLEMMFARQQNREPVPTIAMDHATIEATIEKYAAAAYRCKRAGFRMCMIHGGHGNLLSQFASPLYNKRQDEWGGSLKNRARFTLEVLDRVRQRVGENFVIEFRISADEIHPEGMHLEETMEYIRMIKDKIDIIHVSAGLHGELAYMRYWYQNYLMEREYNVHFAEKIKKAFPELMVCTVGSIMNLQRADAIIAGGKSDFVAMCRPLLADPFMPRKFSAGKEEDHRPCLRCQYCGHRLIIPAVINCAVNPYLGNETEFPEHKVPRAEVKKRVAVVGGGPAGIQAMLTLCERGHDVTLYETGAQLGGNLIPAAALTFKHDLQDYLTYLVNQAKKSGARILLNTTATKELLEAENYDALIIAAGARPIVPKLPGIDKPHVHWAAEANLGKVEIGGKTVVVGAGAVGVECAINLAAAGKDVAIVEMAPDMSNLMSSVYAAYGELLELIKKYGISVHLDCILDAVTDNSIICRNLQTGERVELPADTVLLALGVSPRHEVADALCRTVPATEVYVAGDALDAGNIATSVISGFKAAAYI